MGRGALLTIGWAATAVLAVGFYLRWTEATGALRIGLVGLLPLVLLGPLAAVVLAAWRGRSAYLRLAALATTVVYLATFVGPGAVVGCGSTSAPDEIVIYSHNVYWETGDPEAIAAGIAAADADIVVLQEVWTELEATLAADPSLAAYRYRAKEILDAPAGVALWSRLPMRDAELTWVAKRPILEADVEGPTGPFRVHVTHLAAPLDDGLVADWEVGLEHLRTIEVDRPAVLAGDFNATADHAQFRDLLDVGWTDVHEPKGCGLDATWPVGRRLPFAVLRLDHVLVTDDVEVLGVEIGPAAGSDHRAVIATVRLRRTGSLAGEP